MRAQSKWRAQRGAHPAHWVKTGSGSGRAQKLFGKEQWWDDGNVAFVYERRIRRRQDDHRGHAGGHMVAAQMPSVVAGGVAIMVSSCRGIIVVLIRRTLMVLVGADGYRFTLVIGRAMEWHQHCRQPLQGQSQ